MKGEEPQGEKIALSGPRAQSRGPGIRRERARCCGGPRTCGVSTACPCTFRSRSMVGDPGHCADVTNAGSYSRNRSKRVRSNLPDEVKTGNRS